MSVRASAPRLPLPEAPLRPDRLIALPPMDAEGQVQQSLDEGATWTPATVYLGADVDGWRGQEVAAWNRASREGRVPAGTGHCLWNCFFDVELPARSCSLRAVRAADGEAAWTAQLDLSALDPVVVLDHRRFAAVAGGALPERWTLRDAGLAPTVRPSLYRRLEREKRYLAENDKNYRWDVREERPQPVSLDPGVSGWHRVYVGTEPYSSFSLQIGDDGPAYEVPNAYVDSGDQDQFLQELFIAEADLTGRSIHLAPGGSRFWRDVSVRYLKLVPMTAAEIEHHHAVRELAAGQGRDFAGYLEPCTVAAYWPRFLGLDEHLRNEMRLNVARGSTEVYVHVIRIGSKAWYHSEAVEWALGDGAYAEWTRRADPAQAAVREAHAAGLKVLLDAGMNATYARSEGHYAEYTSDFARQHPEYLCPDRPMLLDYRLAPVREYVVAIAAELLTRYDADGVNLDFARWGWPGAYDVESLVDVLQRVDACRGERQRQAGRPIAVSVRVPYEAPDAEPSPFADVVSAWARRGWVDRLMVELQHEKLFEDLPLSHYRAALDGTGTRLWGDLYWGSWYYGGGPRRDLEIARDLVRRGVDGGLFYYMRGRPIEWESINWQLRLIDVPGAVVDPHMAGPAEAG